MEGYKELDPSFPDRILKMAEKEQCHAHKMDKRVHFSVLSQTAIGLLAGLSAMTFLCYLVYFSIIHDHSGVAIAIVSAMAAIIGIFVYSHKKK